jgi:hypothetical protein
VQVSLKGQQPQRFATDRQVKVELSGVEAGLLRLTNQVTDFIGIPLEVNDIGSGQDRKETILAEVIVDGGANQTVEIDPVAGRHEMDVIFDRNPPVVREVAVSPATATQLSETAFRFTCRADDGDGSGIASVSFFVDANGDDKIDDAERKTSIRGRRSAADPNLYSAEFGPLPVLKTGRFRVEAEAKDRVNYAAVGLAAFEIAPMSGKDRPSFGATKKEEPPAGKKP